jgi:hypothetical protein
MTLDPSATAPASTSVVGKPAYDLPQLIDLTTGRATTAIVGRVLGATGVARWLRRCYGRNRKNFG